MERADKRRNIDKVAAALVKNPLASTREAAQMAGVSNCTVSVLREEAEQKLTKDPRITSLVEKDMKLIEAYQDFALEHFTNPDKRDAMKLGEAVSAAKDSTARYMLMKGSLTGNDGAFKDSAAIKSMNPQEIADYIKQALMQ
jgi:hypothetical protein